MKTFITSLFLFLVSVSYAQEISLFDSKGAPVAYVDTDDDDLTIYLWAGKPVAYVSGDNIYGFNGKHLGWWEKGIIRDHDGNAVGVTKEAASMYTQYEGYKGYKQYKPYKAYKQYAPYKPYFSMSWSSSSFKMFLLQGVNN